MPPVGSMPLEILPESPKSVWVRWEVPAKPNGNLSYSVLFTGIFYQPSGKSQISLLNSTPPLWVNIPPTPPASTSLASDLPYWLQLFSLWLFTHSMQKGQWTLAWRSHAIMAVNELLSLAISLGPAAGRQGEAPRPWQDKSGQVCLRECDGTLTTNQPHHSPPQAFIYFRTARI